MVFFAVGTAVVTGANLVGTALAFGLVIVAMAYSIGGISGCHINPAVSIAMLVSKKITLKEFFVYIISQFLGAIVGAALLYGIVKGAGIEIVVWGTNGYIADTSAGSILASFALEVVLTFVFVFVICNVVASEKLTHGGLVIGLTLTLVHLIGIPLTGTSVNPARSFGPALMALAFGAGTTALEQVWLFLVAPLIGGVLAALLFMLLNKKKKNKGQ